MQKKEKAKTEADEQKDDFSDDEESKAEFKTYRRIMFLIGKAFKYTCWAISATFLYHLYLVMSKDKPEEGLGAFEPMLTYGYMARGLFEYIKDLLTKPPVNSLLMERPPTPPGY